MVTRKVQKDFKSSKIFIRMRNIRKYSAYSETGLEIDEVTFGNNVGLTQQKQKMEKIWKAENRSSEIHTRVAVTIC